MASYLSKTLKFRKPFRPIPKFPFSTSQTLSPPPASVSASSSVSASAAASQSEDLGRWSKLLLFVPGAITFGLGTWQIFRRQDKIEMLEYRRKRLEMEPIELNRVGAGSVDNDVDSLEFRKVVCEGLFDEGKYSIKGENYRKSWRNTDLNS